MTKIIRAIRIDGQVAYVPLTKGYEAIIDAADVPLVCQWNWHADVARHRNGDIRSVYAMRKDKSTLGSKGLRMHRVIVQTPDGMGIDHRDGNGLNNRRNNLRAATTSQNNHNRRINLNNTSGVKGVYWHKFSGKWLARIGLNGKRRQLGLFTSIDEAAAAYAEASAELHGDFGTTGNLVSQLELAKGGDST